MSIASKKWTGVIWGFVVAIFNFYVIFYLILGDGAGVDTISEWVTEFIDVDWSWWLCYAVILLVPPVIGFASAAFDNELWKVLLKPFLSILVNIAFFILAAIIGLFLYGGIARIIVGLMLIGTIFGKGEEIIAIIVEL